MLDDRQRGSSSCPRSVRPRDSRSSTVSPAATAMSLVRSDVDGEPVRGAVWNRINAATRTLAGSWSG